MKKKINFITITIILLLANLDSDASILKRKTSNQKITEEILLGCDIGPGKCTLEDGYCETKDGKTGRCITYEKFTNKFYCECINICTKEIDVLCHKKCLDKDYTQGICKSEIICPNKGYSLTITKNLAIKCCCN